MARPDNLVMTAPPTSRGRATNLVMAGADHLLMARPDNLIMAAPPTSGGRTTNPVMAGLDPAILTRPELAKDAVPVDKIDGAAARFTSSRTMG
jgi:hypothetical protein